MSAYLLPGVEFNAAIKAASDSVQSALVSIAFEYTANVSVDASKFNSAIDVSKDKDNSVRALLSKDSTRLIVHSDDDICTADAHNMFYALQSLSAVAFNNFSLSTCTNVSRMFMNCKSLIEVNLSSCTAEDVASADEMFSGCISCQSINISRIALPKGTAAYNLFSECYSLRRLSVGSKFAFTDAMALANPQSKYVPSTNGKWNNPYQGTSFSASELAAAHKQACTYYANDVASTQHDSNIVTLKTLKCAASQIASAVSDRLKVIDA